MSNYESVRAQTLTLDISDRARLIDELLVDLNTCDHDELDDYWKNEVDARLAAYHRGDMITIDANESKRRLGLA